MNAVTIATSAPSSAASSAAPPTSSVGPHGTSEGQDSGTAETPNAEGTAADTQASEKTRGEKIREAADKAKRSASRYRAKVQETERLSREYQASQAKIEELSQVAQRGQTLEQIARQNPLEFLQRIGVPTDRVVQQALTDGSPEAQIAQLRAQLEADKAERLKLEQAVKEKENIQAVKAHREAFFQASQDATKYPNLQGIPKSLIVPLGRAVAIEAFEKTKRDTGVGIRYSEKQILSYLNKQYASPQTAGSDSKTVAGRAAPSGPDRRTPGNGSATLTNALASSQFTTPSDWEKLDDVQQRAALAAWLKTRRK